MPFDNPVELMTAFLGALLALFFLTRSLPRLSTGFTDRLQPFAPPLLAYLQRPGLLASVGILLLRLSIGLMMVHHGQEKLADPQQFASTYVASLHLPSRCFLPMWRVSPSSSVAGWWCWAF